MRDTPKKIAFEEWDRRYSELRSRGMEEPSYNGPLRRHIEKKDFRLLKLKYDNSEASLRLWNFLLTEEDRLHRARTSGKKIIGTMKDLGTVPVMAYSLPRVVAFYPDGAWWIPCVMELSSGDLNVADSLGIDESFCPVRAMLGAFITEAHFPIPDLLICSVGATCDDFSAIAQRLNSLGFPILWWEIPHRRHPDPDEKIVHLPGGFLAPESQVSFVKAELKRVRLSLETLTGEHLDDDKLSKGIKKVNEIRRLLGELRRLTFTAKICPLPALEMLIAEMLIIHFCSDREETHEILQGLLEEVQNRVKAREGVLSEDAIKVFWVNPVADLRVMNLLEECGGRICGTEYLFSHALDEIPEDIPPMDALAQMALADPMVGPSSDRAERICADIQKFGAETVVISRIPGASHCAVEGMIIGDIIQSKIGIPISIIEVPPVSDSTERALCTRLEALMEIVKRTEEKMIYVGIDAGSRAIKVVFLNGDNLQVLSSSVMDQGVEQESLALKLCEQLFQKNGIRWKDIRKIVATGCGRNLITFADTTITEITCHAYGVRHFAEDTMTIIEIGGQDSKLIRLNTDGSVRDFAMNDRCAAGTGRFFEVVASRLGVELQVLGKMAGKSKKPAVISSMCVVFAETEIIGLLAAGIKPKDIVAGIQKAIASRVSAMVGRNITPPIVFTGGVAMIPGMDSALQSVLGLQINSVPEPLMTGALGAAILASRQ